MFLHLIRAIDGMLFGIIVLFLLALFPALGGTGVAGMQLGYLLPVLWIAWCSHRLPVGFHDIPDWQEGVYSLRLAAVAMAGLSPFAIWWMQSPDNLYFYANTVLGAVAAVALMFQLNLLVLRIARFAGHGGMELEARMARHLTLYMMVVTLALVVLVAFFRAWLFGASIGEEARGLIELLPRAILFIPLMPIVLTASLLGRVRRPLEEMFHAVVQDRL